MRHVIFWGLFTGLTLASALIVHILNDKRHTPHDVRELPRFERVGGIMDDMFEPEYEVELVSQDICIIRNVNTDEQWEVKPTEIDQFFMFDNQ